MKNPWSKYATNERLIKKGYFRKHSDGSSGRKAHKTSRSHCIQQSGKSQEEEIAEILDKTYHIPTSFESSGNSGILEYGSEVVLTEQVVFIGEENEERGKEESPKTSKRRQKRIQGTDQRRSETSEVLKEEKIKSKKKAK